MTNRRSLNESKAENRGDVVFSSTSPLVNDNKDHFPINNLNQARNAIARVNQYDKIPDWYNGKSLKQLINKVNKDVHKKYPSIKISDLNESDSEQHLNSVDKMYDTLLEFLGPENLLNSLIFVESLIFLALSAVMLTNSLSAVILYEDGLYLKFKYSPRCL